MTAPDTRPSQDAPESPRRRRDRLVSGAVLLALFGISMILMPPRIPSGNELIYLLAPWHNAHPDFLPGDWTFHDWGREHLVFNWVTAGAMRVLPLVAVGWLGRILGCLVILAGLLRVGRHLGLTAPAAGAAIALWLVTGQALVGGEWIIGTMEAKVAAYGCLVWAVDRLLADRDRAGGLLLGLTFTLHASVGLQAGAALLGGLLMLGREPRRIAIVVGWATLAALPGVFIILPFLRGPGITEESWRLLVLDRMPWHLDAVRFGIRPLTGLALSVGSVLLLAVRRREPGWRFLGGMLAGLSLVFLGGYAARVAEQWSLLQIFPFRLLPPLAALGLCFVLVRLCLDFRIRGFPLVAAAMALGAFLVPGNPLERVGSEWNIRQSRGGQPDDDAGQALQWLAANTPANALTLTPPARKDAFLLSQRAQVVSWDAIPYDRVAEWRDRLECVVGPMVATEGERIDGAWFDRAYRARGADELLACAHRMGAGYIVSPAEYPWPVRYQHGEWRVYQVP
ncbi:MAG: DUF6798 domain-containing protein [Gemmatimonadales bacterium]